MKITGLSINGSKYAGLNVNKQIIMSMALSGLVSGILGVMFFVIQEKQVGSQYLSFNQLPTLGFEGIAIALLAFSNPLGIIPIAFIFGILQSGSSGLVEYKIDNSFSNLIIGIMMYFAAISVLFMRFKPIQMVYT
jgi:simple sugar transport system permease protein